MDKKEERPEYQRVLLTYLDVLGFRELIESSKGNAFQVSQIYELLRHLQQQYSQMGRVEQDVHNNPRSVLSFRNFSGLMIRVTEMSHQSSLTQYLNWEVLALANTQCDLVCSGTFLRGALCIGDLCIDESVTFGPCIGAGLFA